MTERDRNYPPLKYFKRSEFDSPDEKGSGDEMCPAFLQKLDEARAMAGIPFKITSGYRTQAHHDDLTRRGYQTSKTSAHLKGLAADIRVKDSRSRWLILNALILSKFNRIGIGKSFIHCDVDETKTGKVIWTYYK